MNITPLLFHRFSIAIFFAVVTISQASVAKPESIQIQIGGEPSSLDPARLFDQYSIGILRNVVEGLFVLDAEGKLQNGLAETYRVSKDGLTYRFKLRKDAKWSDGRPVTIDDCVFGLLRAIDPKTASPEAEFFYVIEGARDAAQGRKPLSAVAVARQGEELVIKLEKKQPIFPMFLSLPVAAPVRKDELERRNGKWDFQMPSNGPYRVAAYRPSDEVKLEPNPHHRTPGKHPIQIRILQEEITALSLFESGHLDVITTVTPTEAEKLKKRNLLRTFPSTTVIYLGIVGKKAPLNDLSWRRAIASQIDRSGLSIATRSLFEPSYSFVPKTLDAGARSTALPFADDVARIKALTGKPRLRLSYGSSATNKVIAEKIQSDLKIRLGIELSLEPMELKTLIQKLFNDPPDLFFLGKSAIFDDPISHLEAFNSHPSPNFAHYQSSEYDQLIETIKGMPAGKKRVDAVRLADSMLVDKDVIVVPLLLRMQIFGVSPKLRNFKVSPFQVIQFAELEK